MINWSEMRVNSKEELFRKIEGFLEEKEIRTELKIIFIDVGDFFNFENNEDLSHFLKKIAETHGWLRKFLVKYKVTLKPMENDFYELLFVGNKERVVFHVLKKENFLEVYSWEKWEKIDRTLTRLINYLPWSHAWITPRELEDFVLRTLGEEAIQGFTSKSKPYGVLRKDVQKEVTIRVWGGDLQDLEKAREHYHAEPTRIDNRILKSNPGIVLDSTIITKGIVSIKTGIPFDVFSHKEASFEEFKDKEKRYEVMEAPIKMEKDLDFKTLTIEYPEIPNIKIKVSDFWDEHRFQEFKRYILNEDPDITGFETEAEDGFYSLMLSDFINAGDFQLVAYPKENEFIIYPFNTSRRENLKLFFEKIVMSWDAGAKLIVNGGLSYSPKETKETAS